jgi:hypothetical protein
MVKRSCLCCRESGSHGPRSSVVFLNPSRSLGLSVAYESVMTLAEDRSDLDRRLYGFAPQAAPCSRR